MLAPGSTSTFDRLWADLTPIGRGTTGGYHRFAWTAEDAELRSWFAGEAARLGLDLVTDRAGNQWAWWGDVDAGVAAGKPGVVVGSHLDSVPDGGAYDGPLGVVSAFAAVDRLQATGFEPRRPVGIVNFTDEEGARFGIACTGSRLITGALSGDRARGLIDGEGISLADAVDRSGGEARWLGRDEEALRRIGCFVELHVEQGRGLIDLDRPLGVASMIWPHGRWRFELHGEANHAGTTRLQDRRDPMLALAETVLRVRTLAEQHAVLATCAKVRVHPNGVNAIPSRVTGWLDARGPEQAAVAAFVAHLRSSLAGWGAELVEESWTSPTAFDHDLSTRVARVLGDAPVLATGAGHDAGILAAAGIPTAMIFVRNPTGVSHAPSEFADRTDCLTGVDALAAVVTELAG